MATLSTSTGDGIELDLVVANDGNGERSLICIEDIGRATHLCLNNLEALNLAAELTSLAIVNDDGGGMSNSEAVELYFLTREA